MTFPGQDYRDSRCFALLIRRMALLFLYLIICGPDLQSQAKSYFFHAEQYEIEQGLEHDVIGDFRADENGMLWIYTLGSMQLFDGLRFTPVPLPLKDGFYGRFSSNHGNGLFFLSGITLIKLNTNNYVNPVIKTIQLPEMNLTNRDGFIMYENFSSLFISHPNDTVYEIDKVSMQITNRIVPVSKMYRPFFIRDLSRDGYLKDKIEYLDELYRLCEYDLKTRKTACTKIQSDIRSYIRISADSFFILTSNTLDLHTNGRIQSIKLPDSTQGLWARCFLRLSNDKILVAFHKNIREFNMRTLQWTGIYTKPGYSPLIDISIRMVEKDNLGNIYFSTLNQGLVKLYPRNESFDYIGSTDINLNFVHSIAVSDSLNLVVVGTLQEGVILYDTSGNLLHQFRQLDKDNATYVNSICKISETQYVITAQDAYLLTTDGINHQMSLLKKSHPKWQAYYDHFVSKPGSNTFYNSTYEGLMTIRNTGTLSFDFQEGHPLNGAMAMNNYQEGFISFTNDIIKIHNHNFSAVLDSFKLPGLGAGRCILQTGTNQILLGTDLGLFEIEISSGATILNRYYNKFVYSILPGSVAGHFWFSTDYGLFHLNSRGVITHYSKEYGLQENEFNSNAGLVSSTGKLYFGGVNGITAFYPTSVNADHDSISAYISSLSVNNTILRRHFIPQDSLYVFPHNESNISFELLGRGRKSPQNYNYQYWVKGLHTSWVDLKNDPSINFHLAPGNYEFYYHISDQFDMDAPLTRFIRLYIQPPFYARWWFILILALAMMSAIIYFIIMQRRRRELKLRYEIEAKDKIQKDRVRISRELHDNIGAQMATVKRNINFMLHSPLSPDQHHHKMKELEGISTQINQELRDSIWVTQHEYISIGDFMTRLKNYVFQVLGQENNVRVIYVENCDKEILLGPFVTLNLHRICQESINNMLKHSGASEMKICFEGNLHQLKITLKDNGQGFNMDTINEGYGLKNMKQRADQIGASLSITSNPEEGTTLELQLENLQIYKSVET